MHVVGRVGGVGGWAEDWRGGGAEGILKEVRSN